MSMSQYGLSGGARMSAKGSLEFEIRRLRDRADLLEALLKELPELGPAADTALWQVIMDSVRR